MTTLDEIPQLVKDIRTAFADSVYPGDENIVPVSSRNIDDESDEIKAAFLGKHWKEADLSLLLSQIFAQAFFTAQAFRFYLPAYMIVVLNEWKPSGIVAEFLLYSLEPTEDEIINRRFFERINGFSDAQINVIRRFIEVYSLLLEDEDPENPHMINALAFWSSYRVA